MNRTGTAPMDLSLVSTVELNTITSDPGAVSYCTDEESPCLIADAFCPLMQVMNEKDERIERLQTDLDDALRRVRHLDGLAKLGELSAVVAHQIRNPLTGISATAEMLLEDVDETDHSRESLGIILSEIHRLEKTVRNLLDFARDSKPYITRTDLRDAVERVIEDVQPQASSSRVKITGSCPNTLPDAMADQDLLQQAFLNIARNAIQAMPDGGELKIYLFAEETGKGREVRVAITDTGCGISEADVERIFDPFFTTKASGAGLGLAVSKKIIEAQKGRITVDSKPGKGTAFVVSLPAADE